MTDHKLVPHNNGALMPAESAQNRWYLRARSIEPSPDGGSGSWFYVGPRKRSWWRRAGFPILGMVLGGAVGLAEGAAHDSLWLAAWGAFWLGCAFMAALVEWVDR